MTWDEVEEKLRTMKSELSADEDIPHPPTDEAYFSAEAFRLGGAARLLRKTDPPTRILPDGAGGIVFEWLVDETYRAVCFAADGQHWLRFYQNGTLSAD